MQTRENSEKSLTLYPHSVGSNIWGQIRDRIHFIGIRIVWVFKILSSYRCFQQGCFMCYADESVL